MPHAVPPSVAIVGGGPAGLMAAYVLAKRGISVHLYEAKPSVGRKFLIAGRGGLNLTHSEPRPAFERRFGAEQAWVSSWLQQFDADSARAFAQELGIDTFVGTSGRVFPTDMKAAPMLRAWVHRLRTLDVQMHMRHRLQAIERNQAGHWALHFDHDGGAVRVLAPAVILALGGASWPQLGSDGRFVDWLNQYADIQPFVPANCGFELTWSETFRQRNAGKPLKSVCILTPVGADAVVEANAKHKGECVISEYGLEGSLIYAHARWIRDALAAGANTILLDLLPDLDTARVRQSWQQQPAKRSFSERLRRMPGMDALKVDLCLEVHKQCKLPQDQFPAVLKALPFTLSKPRPVAEAISSAGGVSMTSVDDGLMLRNAPGVFCAGEMLNWEAPTGGYLLTACMASGVVTAEAIATWLAGRNGLRV